MNLLTTMKRFTPMLAPAAFFALILAIGATDLAAQSADKAAAEKYNEGLSLLKAKDYEGALNTFIETKSVAEAAGDNGTASKAENYIYRLYYNVGVGYVKAGDLEKALELFDAGIAMNPDYYKNYKGRASVFKAQDNVDAAMQAFVETANKATAAGELDERAKALAQAEGFVAKAMQAEDYNAVLSTGSAFLGFSETANVHYYMAHASNQLGKPADAIMHADQALALDQGSRSQRAKIYFEKAEALRSNGQYEQALASYRDAAYGDYKQRSEYMIEELSGSN